MNSPESDPERLFLTNLPTIDRIIAIQVRRHGLSRTDAEDYASWAKTRVIADNYGILRKFAGRSSLATYLSVVLANLYRDYRNAHWGRWRPSAEATRRGPLAVRLEELLYREGHTVREAYELLRVAGIEMSFSEIAKLAAGIPARALAANVGIDQVVGTSEEPSTISGEWERDDDSQLLQRVIRQLMDQLTSEEALLLRMRFWNNVSVADISRTLRVDQKELYRRFETLKRRLGRELQASGDGPAVAELLRELE